MGIGVRIHNAYSIAWVLDFSGSELIERLVARHIGEGLDKFRRPIVKIHLDPFLGKIRQSAVELPIYF
jgi:hypothetical protein